MKGPPSIGNRNNLTTDELNLLYSAVKNGIINLNDVQDEMTKKHREELLKRHPYDIWQGKDTRYRTYIRDTSKPSGRRMIAKTHEEDLIDYLVGFYKKQGQGQTIKGYTLEMLYPEWKAYKELHTTAANYMRRIDNDWNKYYKGTAIIKMPIINLNKLTLDTWAHRLVQSYNMTKKQYYNSTVIMRQALDFAVGSDIIKDNPFLSVHIDGRRMFRKQKKKPDHTQVFLKAEIPIIQSMALEDFTNNGKLKHKLAPLAILFQFQTGLRLGELCACKYSDVESGNYIHIQRMYRYETGEVVEHTKSACSDRNVFLTGQAKHYIQLAREFHMAAESPGEYIFSVNSGPLSPRSVEYLYKKYCNMAGISHKSSHKSRKTYISALIDGHVNINTIREMAGHSDERTTFGNYCFDRSSETEKAGLITNALAP